MNTIDEQPSLIAPVTRRFAAIFYDSLLLIAVLLIATALVTPLLPDGPQADHHNPWVSLYLFGVTFAFFAWFWTHGGQTLGMRAWRLKLRMEDGGTISLLTALLRFAYSIPAWGVFLFGIIDSSTHLIWPESLRWLQEASNGYLIYLGLAWLVMDNWPNNWRDQVTHTKVVLLAKI